MKNFAFEHDGKTLWYSRSVACSMYLFVYDRETKQWYVLISKRGPGCPSNIGKWNVPGGYLDFDETLPEAARRECYEETGVLYDGWIHFASLSTNIYSKAQNVVCSFYGVMKVDDIMDINTSYEHCEKDEVIDINWCPVENFFKMNMTSAFAFGHEKMIREIFSKRININPIKRWLIRIVERWTKINLSMQ